MNRILILGASGFIGRTIYLELRSYFDVIGTYCTNGKEYGKNKAYLKYCLEENSLNNILEKVQPTIIISSLRGDYTHQLAAHNQLCNYVKDNNYSSLVYLSSVKVFDGKFMFPSYENDTPFPESNYGKFKASVERLLLNNIPEKSTVLRLPIALGIDSPRILQLRQSIKHEASFEVYPNLSISITTANKVAQQIHYIINKALYGVFHLASDDMILHEDLFREITSKMGTKKPIFKSVFRKNEDEYLAILPKKNQLPKNYRISVDQVIEDSTLSEEIVTFKN